jgi:hypothetical protein
MCNPRITIAYEVGSRSIIMVSWHIEHYSTAKGGIEYLASSNRDGLSGIQAGVFGIQKGGACTE